jgi:serine/threonine protein kinase
MYIIDMINLYKFNKIKYIDLFSHNDNNYIISQKGGNAIDINNMKIIKPIGTGNYGNVYMVQSSVLRSVPESNSHRVLTFYKNNNESSDDILPYNIYALKIEYLLKTDKMIDLESKVNRNLKFDQDIGSIYPDMFLNIIAYDIKDNCQEHKTVKQKSIEKKYNEIKSSKCLRILYRLIDGTLTSEMQNKMTDKEIKSMVMQLIYAISLLHSKGYVHCDINRKNIGYYYTNDKEISVIINNNKYIIPIFSKRFIIIDYGNVLHPDFIMSKYEIDKYEKFKNLFELDSIFFGHVILNNYKPPKSQDIDLIHHNLTLSPDYYSINQITSDPLHQIIYNDILNNKFLESQIVTDLAILYIKLGRNPEKLITYILKSL